MIDATVGDSITVDELEASRGAGPGVVIAGIPIPEGANVGLMVPSANRDEEIWGRTADVFDILPVFSGWEYRGPTTLQVRWDA